MDAGYNSKAEPGDFLMVRMWSDRGEELRMKPRSLGQARTQLPPLCDGRQGPHSLNPIPVHACTHTRVCESPSEWRRH